MTILIADDSRLLRERIRLLLQTIANVSIVGEAENGKEALRMIDQTRPDMVIIDIRMPEMNGIELLKKVRERGPGPKICILTNYPYKQYRDRCLADGADYFFDKNQDIEQLMSVITELSHELENN